jgi:uncharacterized lipoprotein
MPSFGIGFASTLTRNHGRETENLMKKLIALIAVASLALVLSGCGKKQEGAEGTAGKQTEQSTPMAPQGGETPQEKTNPQ